MSTDVEKKLSNNREYLCPDNIDKIFLALENIKNHLMRRNQHIKPKWINKICRMLLFILTFLLIAVGYYLYVFWNLIPRFESSVNGLNFKFWAESNWSDDEYRKAFIYFAIFHFLFIMMLISLIRTIFTDPGYVHDEYMSIYSAFNMSRVVFQYLLGYQNENYKMDLSINDDLLEEIDNLLKYKLSIKNVVDAYRESYLYSKHQAFYQTEDGEDNSYFNGIDTEVLDAFENFDMRIKEYISKHKNRKLMNIFFNLEYKDKNINNHRFCSFCIIKKPDRVHHCRHCRRCVRKMDHHCHVLATCIGHQNYKFFFLTIMYSSLMTVFMLATSIGTTKFYFMEYRYSHFTLVYIFYIFCLLSLAVLDCLFFFIHIMFVFNNLSTIEYQEKCCKEDPSWNHIFNMGYEKNLIDVFGKGPKFFWFLPISNNNETSGYAFSVDEKVYEGILNKKITHQMNKDKTKQSK